MKRVALLLGTALLLAGLYSYKLLTVPANLTVDEAVFGYNSVLLANTGRDENGRLLPFFVQTAGTNDYHQPATQYFLVALFKIFGPSVFMLRASSVIVAVFSVLSFYFLAKNLLPRFGAVIAASILALTPILLIQAHMGQENIMPLPFIIIWLYALFKHHRGGSKKWLIISGIFLGASFYTYKGMRAITPVWLLLSLLWLRRYRRIFLLAAAPFFLIIPLLEHFYAGAILGGASPEIKTVYDFFLPYLSAFDLSYLFVRGDIVELHSTGRHGMLLLSSLPLVLIGIYRAVRQKDADFKFILICLLSAPLLFGLVGSIHRFSRLLALLPFYSLLAGSGFDALIRHGRSVIRLLAGGLLILIVVNFIDFARYYWFTYPPLTQSIVGELKCYQDVALLAKEAKLRAKVPFIHRQVAEGGGVGVKFYQMIYFSRLLPVIPDNDPPPAGGILLSQRQEIDGQTKKDLATVCHYIHER